MDNKEHIVLIATKPEFAASPQIMDCINKHSSRFRASLVSRGGSHYKMSTQHIFGKNPSKACKVIDSADRIFLMDYRGLWCLFDYLQYKRGGVVKKVGKAPSDIPKKLLHEASKFCRSRKPAVFCTGSGYKISYSFANSFFLGAGFQIFAMTGLLELAPRGSLLLWHPYNPMDHAKRSILTITHSPGKRATSRRDVKGTGAIRSVIKSLQADLDVPFEYIVLVDKPHKKCLRIKSRSHIFIEQLAPKVFRGMGKSGLEAFAGGCVVLGPYKLGAFDGSGITPPPAIIANNGRELYTALRALLTDKKYLTRQMNASKAWRPVISLENTAKYIDKNLS